MKYIISIFISAGIILALYSCSKPARASEPNTTIGSTLVDITDPLLSLPNSAGISAQFAQLTSDHSRGAIFRLATLSEIRYTPQIQTEIKPQSFLLSNPGQRNIEVQKFFENVGIAIDTLEAAPVGQNYSELYVPIATEANYLMSIPADGRTLNVYSNLYENSYFSLYRTADLELLASHPEKVALIFQTKLPLQNLKGLRLNLIYRSTSYRDSQLFAQISNVYKLMFGQAGATVTISANLQNP